jgi:hypothetical protein
MSQNTTPLMTNGTMGRTLRLYEGSSEMKARREDGLDKETVNVYTVAGGDAAQTTNESKGHLHRRTFYEENNQTVALIIIYCYC